MNISVRILIFFVLSTYAHAFGASGQDRKSFIRPGTSVAGIRLNDPMPKPADQPILRQLGIELKADGDRIERIDISSPRYVLEGSWLSVGESNMYDVLKFYGTEVKKEKDGSDILMTYGSYGLKFTIDNDSKVVRKITIFRPQLKLDPKLILKQFKEYRK